METICDKAAQEQRKLYKLLVVTESKKEIIERDNLKIEVIPLYEWLLKDVNHVV